MAKRYRSGYHKNPNPSNILEEDCWEFILMKLPIHDLQSVSLVSKFFHSISNRLFFNLKISESQDLSDQQILPQLLTRFSSLKSIDFDYPDHLSTRDYSVVQIARSGLKNLKMLVLNYQKSLPRIGIMELGFMGMRSLKILHCSNFMSMNDSDLSVIATSLPWLQELAINSDQSDYSPYWDFQYNGHRCVTDKGITELAAKLSGLIRIDMSGNPLISDQSLHCLLSRCKHIAEIYCSNCDGVTVKGISDAIRCYSKLKYLKYDDFDYDRTDSDGCSFQFGHNYDFCGGNGNIVASIASASIPLEKLILDHTLLCTNRYISTILQFLGNVRTIVICQCSLGDATFCMIVENCHNLVEFEMKDTALGDETNLLIRKKNHSIKNLKLNFNRNLRDDVLIKIALFIPNLEVLEVCDCPKVTKEGIGYVLNNCVEMRHLNVNNCRLDSAPWADVNVRGSELKLEVLCIANTWIGGKDLGMIAMRCPRLVQLEIDYCPNLRAKDVKELIKRCKRLRKVSLGEFEPRLLRLPIKKKKKFGKPVV